MRCLLLASCAVVIVSTHGCVDPVSAEQLTQAVDAALMELQDEKGWFHNLRTTSGYTDAMSVASCTPDAGKWSYPPADEATGILARVLSTKTLKIAGVQWARGGAADYITNPDSPTGFWPDYASAIVAKLSAHYGIEIKLERVYYPSSPLVVESVELGKDVDMSEPYYYLAGFHGSRPRIEALAHSCVTAGTASFFFTKKGSGITTVDQLYDVLQAGPNRNVGFIGSGNYDAVSAILPDNVSPSYDTNATDLARNVMNGAHVAGYSSEGSPPAENGDFEVFTTGIVSPRVALFHKDMLASECSDHDGPRSRSSSEIALIIVAAVALLLAITIVIIIVKERKGKPLFMPLLKMHPPDGKAGNEA